MNVSSGENPLTSVGKFKQNPDKLRKLLENGADSRINEKTSSRRTPLIDAAMSNSPEIVSVLLEYGADPRAQCDKAMLESIMDGSVQVVELLLNSGVNPNETCHESMKKGMLDWALKCRKARDSKIIDLLIDHGAQ